MRVHSDADYWRPCPQTTRSLLNCAYPCGALGGSQVWGGCSCASSKAGYSFSVNTVTSGRKTWVAMNLVLKGLSPLPDSIFEELVPSSILSRTPSFPCPCHIAGSWVIWVGDQGRCICTLHVVHTISWKKIQLTRKKPYPKAWRHELCDVFAEEGFVTNVKVSTG